MEDRPDYKPDKDRGARRSRDKGDDRGERRGGRGERSGDRGDRGNRGGERGDRGGNQDRRKKEEHMTTLFVSLGKAAGVRPSDLLGMFYREGKIPDNSVGHIQLFDRHSLVDVDKKVADQLCDNLSDSKLRNQRFRIGHDRMG